MNQEVWLVDLISWGQIIMLLRILFRIVSREEWCVVSFAGSETDIQNLIAFILASASRGPEL